MSPPNLERPLAARASRRAHLRATLERIGVGLGLGAPLASAIPRRDPDRIQEFAQLEGLRIGIGPEGSGTATIARQLFALPDLRPLGAILSSHPLVEELDLAQEGTLDLAMVVMDEDAALLEDAVN